MAVILFLTSFLLSGLSVLLCLTVTGWMGVLVSVFLLGVSGTLLLSSALFSGEAQCYDFKLILVFAVGIFLSVVAIKRYTTDFGFSKQRIVALEGRMIYDSSFSSSGKGLVRISVQRCWDNCGNSVSAKGIVAAVGSQKAVVTSGLEVYLEGKFSEELFIYDSFQVKKRSWVNNFRELLIERIEKRLYGDNYGNNFDGQSPDEAAVLSSLLLLGRAEDHEMPLQEVAKECGCSHVLALSGMHLSVLASFCAIFGKRKWAKVLSFIIIGAFVFVAGPRPSLVRAAIMFFLGKRFSAKQKVVMAFLIQCVLLPFSMLDLGCCYGYVSVFAILYLWDLVRTPVVQLVRSKVLSPFLLSVTVLIFCAPVQLINDGTWCPVSILVSPLASFLITISMVLGVILLSFGRLEFLTRLNSLVYTTLLKLFEFFSKFPKAGWLGYAIMIVAVIALEVFCLIYRKRRKARVKEYRFNAKFDLNFEEMG